MLRLNAILKRVFSYLCFSPATMTCFILHTGSLVPMRAPPQLMLARAGHAHYLPSIGIRWIVNLVTGG